MQYKQAREIATRVYKALEPHCVRLDIAGSVRREKPEVKDIEIVCEPIMVEQTDLFGEAMERKRNIGFVHTVRELGVLLKGNMLDGRYLQILLSEGINLDLFIPQPTDYYRQLSIRTGSADYSHKVLANAWLKKGWCGTEDGLRLQTECYQKLIGKYPDGRDKFKWICNTENPTLPDVWRNELEFFHWLNLEWLEPSKRNV